jgi:hypothetical protein
VKGVPGGSPVQIASELKVVHTAIVAVLRDMRTLPASAATRRTRSLNTGHPLSGRGIDRSQSPVQ